MRVGILTGGGDCPGLNAVIRAAVRKGQRHYGDEIVGFRDGWRGVMDKDWEPLDIERLRGSLPRGGTILGTSRVQPFMYDDGIDRVRATFEAEALDGLVAIGGEGTLSVTRELCRLGLPIVGVPKTIDNDIQGTERTFGFDTAVTIATEAIDRLHTTAESHNRVMVVEVMGRHVGHIATWAGLAGGATMTLIPEEPFDIDEVCQSLVRRHEGGRYASIVVVAEGAKPIEGSLSIPPDEYDEYGHIRLGGIANRVATEIEARTGFETRVTILGHVQRGGSPTPFDRVLSTRYGVAAIDAVHERAWGQMVALQADRIVRIPLDEAVSHLKTVNPDIWDCARQFFA
jgi:ATP-dependent phosphofructokinase / diphosphate-dependent phosphofructokinase